MLIEDAALPCAACGHPFVDGETGEMLGEETGRIGSTRKFTTDPSVGDACDQLRFCTPSRLSRQYARLFGELPSATPSR
jgi:hypothetical protein